MDSTLIADWLGDAQVTPILDIASVSAAREHVRREAERVGLGKVEVGALASITSELATNQLAYARGGEIGVRPFVRDGVPGIEVIAADRGDGIADPALALRGAPRVSGSLGVGLAAVLELSDEVDFDVRILEGTCVWARKLATRPPRARSVGIFGKPCEGEIVSGDQAAFVRLEAQGALLVALADGLGHGPAARVASDAAMRVVRAEPALTPERLLERCHVEIARTRGAVMAAALVAGHAADVASVGNVSAHAYSIGPRPSRRFAGSSAVLGLPRQARSIPTERLDVGPNDALVLFSDGLTSRATIEGDFDLLREHPIVIAQRMVERFHRGNDDSLVLVAR